jgi:hypothetical protein
MKFYRVIASLVTLLLLTTIFSLHQNVSAQAAFQPDVPDGAGGQTYYTALPYTVTVDGDFSEWADVPYVSVTSGPQMPSDPSAASSLQFATTADANWLYVSVLVTDPHIIANKHDVQYWQEDSIELYINASGDLGLTEYTPTVAQITIPAASIGLPIDQTLFTGTNFEQVGTRAVVVATADGYAAEIAIPLQNALWDITPRHDGRLGFQIQLNGASELDRDLKLSWSSDDQTADQSYINPSVFGELIFFQVTLTGDQSNLTPEPLPTLSSTAESTDLIAPTRPSAAETPIPLPPVDPESGFQVEGTQILDPEGNVFVPKGVNVSGYNWVWQRPTVNDVDLIADCWNFNLVRVNSFLFTGQTPYAQYRVNNDLDAIVEAYTSRGIVVVFEGHDRIGSYYEGEDLSVLVQWFYELALRYRDNPYVWFDVMNEPGSRTGIDVENWVSMHGKVIDAIRNGAQAHNIIIVEGAYGGQDSNTTDAGPVTDSAILQYSDDIFTYNGNNFENIMFSIHTYDLWNHGDEKLNNFFDRVAAQDLALVVGEYGIFTDQDTFPAAQSMFNTTIPRGIGRIVWHWDGGDHNDLTENTTQGGGWEIDNCENPTNLSWMGQQIWNDNHTP